MTVMVFQGGERERGSTSGARAPEKMERYKTVIRKNSEKVKLHNRHETNHQHKFWARLCVCRKALHSMQAKVLYPGFEDEDMST